MLLLLINHPHEGGKMLKEKGKGGEMGEMVDIFQVQVF